MSSKSLVPRQDRPKQSYLRRRRLLLYQREVQDFMSHYPKLMAYSPYQASSSQLEKYLRLRLEKGLSHKELRLHKLAIEHWHMREKNRKILLRIPTLKAVFKELRVIESDELERLFHNFGMHLCGLLLRLIYASGLRLEEALHLQRKNFNFQKMTIYVHDVKTGKFLRETIFSKSLLYELNILIQSAKSDDFLFSSRNIKSKRNIPLARRTPQIFLTNHCKELGLEGLTVRALRDNFAIHLLKMGIDWRHVASLMGLRTKKSVERYQRYVHPEDLSITSPMDHYQGFRHKHKPPIHMLTTI